MIVGGSPNGKGVAIFVHTFKLNLTYLVNSETTDNAVQFNWGFSLLHGTGNNKLVIIDAGKGGARINNTPFNLKVVRDTVLKEVGIGLKFADQCIVDRRIGGTSPELVGVKATDWALELPQPL